MDNYQYNRTGLKTFGGMDHPKERIARPVFNPSIPVSKQQSYVRYLPDEIPVVRNGKFVDNVQELPYDAPPNNPNQFQYSGPFYNVSANGTSDDMYGGFIKLNETNLENLNDIYEQKILPSHVYQ